MGKKVIIESKIEELRGKGIVCFRKNGKLWVHLNHLDTIYDWLKAEEVITEHIYGWSSLNEFTEKTGLTANNIKQKTVALGDKMPTVLFAKDMNWWNSLDMERLRAVFNERVWDWALSGGFLSRLGELEFGLEIIKEMEKVSGPDISSTLSSIFMNQDWYPAMDTTGFLEDVAGFLAAKFDVSIQVNKSIRYFI